MFGLSFHLQNINWLVLKVISGINYEKIIKRINVYIARTIEELLTRGRRFRVYYTMKLLRITTWLFLHLYFYVCLLISVVCLYLFVCVCVFPFPIFHSDLDCPDAWVFSGLLLFSCSLRYLFHSLSPSTFKHSFFPPIFTCFWPQTRRPQIRNRYTRMFVYLCRYSKRPAHRLVHTCAHPRLCF